MSNSTPLISILICNYNYSRYIKESLDSAINQDYSNIEIVIVDDGSQDDSVKVIEEYIKKHPTTNINLRAKNKNQGICYARNDALNLANGEYVLFLDSDDTIPSDYISRLYHTAIKQNADVVYGDMRRFGDETGQTDFPDYSPEKLLLYNYINASSLVKRAKIKNHKFDVKLNRRTSEDYDFWLGLSLMGLKFVKAKDVYLNYRIQNSSRNENASDLKTRIFGFIEVWKYSINKYQKKYPGKIQNSIVFDELDYQIQKTGEELRRLNEIVHQELIPELGKREQHISYLDQRIEELNNYIAELSVALKNTQNSYDFRLGKLLLKPLRVVKKIAKK